MTSYLTLDVFTDEAYGGNPLAVIPDAGEVPEAAMQVIAREFNYSETTFVLPAEDPAHTARVRIFTPTMEVPFAGHPVIGTAVALAAAGHGPDMVFELGIGPVAVHAAKGAARFTTSAALTRVSEPSRKDAAACIGLSPGQIASDPVQASLGLPFCLVELTDRAALSACLPVTDAFRAAAGKYPSDLDFAVYAWVREGDEIHARMFAPLDNIPEDPATGSAAATLSAFLGGGRYVILQGIDMGRPSRINTEVAGGSVTVAGAARQIMAGRIVTLPGDSPGAAG